MMAPAWTGWLGTAAVAASVIGMMLVIGGVVASGLFMPGVVLIGIGMVTFLAAAVAEMLRAEA